MGMPSMPELIVVLLIIVVLFGAKKIPDLAQGIGKGIKNFKKAMNEDDDDDKEKEKITKEQTTDTASTEKKPENK